MLKKITFHHWKSFGDATLDIDPLTILIGANASGKSNALDGLLFLSRTALGKDLQASLAGDPALTPLRGGVDWAVLRPTQQVTEQELGDPDLTDGVEWFKPRPTQEFTLQVEVHGEDERTDYLYSITVETSPRVQLVAESLDRVRRREGDHRRPSQVALISTDPPDADSPSITARLYNEKARTKKESRRSTSILSQLTGLALRKEITEGLDAVSSVLQTIFILDTIPANMRTYSAFSDSLQPDAANIAGVLAALPAERKTQVEATLSKYGTLLTERDICRVWAEPVGRFGQDAMLYCEEQWAPDRPETIVDARSMSDGTLRFLAILTALLTRPEGSQLIIEEVDNGIFPARAGLLLSMLREIGRERHIDILVTTHNPALLNALGPEMVPFVVIAHRSPQTGDSTLTLLEDLENLPKLLAAGPLGQVVTQGSLERSLAGAA